MRLLQIGFGFAVRAAVDSVLSVGKPEFMDDFLLGCGDAAGILAADDVFEGLRHVDAPLFHQRAVADEVHRDAGVHEAQHVEINGDVGIDLDDVLLAGAVADGVFDDGHGGVQGVEVQKLVDPHAPPGGDVVDDDAVLDGVDVHARPSLSMPSSLRISAMRMYLPFSTCLK